MIMEFIASLEAHEQNEIMAHRSATCYGVLHTSGRAPAGGGPERTPLANSTAKQSPHGHAVLPPELPTRQPAAKDGQTLCGTPHSRPCESPPSSRHGSPGMPRARNA